MIGMATKEDIRKKHFIEGQSIRKISRETGHSRQYIRKVIAEEVPTIPRYKLTVEKEKPVVGPYLDTITEWLVEDMKRPSKQRHTALRIYERLCEEYGYTSAYSTIRRYVRLIKTRLGGEKQEVFIPLEFELGSHAQVDWGEAEIILKGKRQKVYLFVMMIITTNLEFPKWNQIFGDEKMTAALLDRITHNAHILITNGESYRLKQTLKRRRESNYE